MKSDWVLFLDFFKRGRARYKEREVHEHMIVDGLTGLRFCLFISFYELLISLKIIELQMEQRDS